MSKVSSSSGRMAVDSKRSCGLDSAPKKSAERRCASRSGSSVLIESTSAVPNARAVLEVVPDFQRALELLEPAAHRRDTKVLH